jgi:hypothetical protein
MRTDSPRKVLEKLATGDKATIVIGCQTEGITSGLGAAMGLSTGSEWREILVRVASAVFATVRRKSFALL